MKAAILEEFHQPLVVEEVELLPPAPDGAIVRTTASAFCITDCMNQRGELGKKLPTILGHAGFGVVEEVGAEVTRRPPRRPRRRARDARVRRLLLVRSAAGPISAPRSSCPSRTWPTGRTARRSRARAAAARTRRRCACRRAGSSRSRPSLPDDQLSLLGCGITTGLGAALNAARIEPGSSVAVVGCGHLGLWMVQGARVADAGRIIAVEPIEERRRLAGELGATDLVDPAAGDPVEQVRELTERPRRRLRARGGRPRRARRSRRS